MLHQIHILQWDHEMLLVIEYLNHQNLLWDHQNHLDSDHFLLTSATSAATATTCTSRSWISCSTRISLICWSRVWISRLLLRDLDEPPPPPEPPVPPTLPIPPPVPPPLAVILHGPGPVIVVLAPELPLVPGLGVITCFHHHQQLLSVYLEILVRQQALPVCLA